jgi:hypothetical protein
MLLAGSMTLGTAGILITPARQEFRASQASQRRPAL